MLKETATIMEDLVSMNSMILKTWRRMKTRKKKRKKRRRKKKRRKRRRRRAMLIPLAPCPKSLPMTCEAWTRWSVT
jgi:hypothetical protein